MAGSFSKEYQMMFALNGSLQSGFTQSFNRASSVVLEMQKDLQTLSKEQGDIAAYEKQQRAIQQTEDKLKLLTQQYDNIQKEIQETEGFSASLENQLLSKQAQIDKTNSKLEEQKQKLGQTGEALLEAGIDTSNLTEESKRLENEMKELKEQQEEAARSAGTFGEQTEAALDAIQSALAAAGIAMAFKEMASAYRECLEVSGSFESAMSQVAATMGVSFEEVKEQADFAKEMGAATSFSAVESAEGLNILAMAGLDANEQMAALPTVLNLAAAGAMDMATSAGYVTGIVKGFSDSMDHADYYADLMAKGASIANTSVSQLGDAMSQSAATASGYGQTADSVTLSLLRLAEQNVVGQTAATSLNRAMADLYTPTGDAKIALDELGVSMYDIYGNARDFNDVVDDLNAALSNYSAEEANALKNTIFTTNGLNAFNKMTVSTSETIEKFKTELQGAGGSAAKQAATQLDNMNGELTIMNSALEGVQISMGELWQDEMTGLYREGGELLGLLNTFIKENPGLIKGLTAGIGTLGALATGIAAVSAGMKVASAAAGLFSISVAGIPLMAVAAGFSAVVAGGVMLSETFNEDKKKIEELTASAVGLRETLNDTTETYNETVGATEAAANVAERYIGSLEELEAAGLDTEEEHKRYHNTLALLCETIPELADLIDLENDTINGGTDALRKNTAAWKENAIAQAYQEQLTALYAAQADVMIEAEKNSIKLTEAEYKLSDAQKKYDAVVENHTKNVEKYNRQLEDCRESGKRYADICFEMEREQQEFYNAVFETENELYEAQKEVDAYRKAIEEDTAAVSEAEAQIVLAEEAVNNLTAAEERNTEVNTEAEAAQAAMTEAISYAVSQVDDLKESYYEAYEAAWTSVKGQFDLWDQAESVVAASVDSINKSMESQIEYWQSYNENLETITGRAAEFEGLSDVMASFADGSEESIAAVAGIADALNKGNEEDVQRIVDNYRLLCEEQAKVAGSIADLTTEYTVRMNELTDDMTQKVEELNLSDEAKANGMATIAAYIQGAELMAPQVTAAYKSIAQSASDALSGSFSGTKIDGYASGTENAAPGLKLVGEEGPELIAFRGGEKVLNANETKAVLSGTSGLQNHVSVAINIQGNATNDVLQMLEEYGNQIAETVMNAIEDANADSRRRAYA